MEFSGETVKRLREQRGWSQEHLAGAAGLSARTVQRM
ncbi:XRE family transcriptional regulator, partial [Mycobacterium tuberculosis]